MVTTELDLKKLNQDIATLRKNRENVPLELLKTKYKKPYAKLKEEIRAQFEIYVKHLIMLGILKTGPDLTGAKAQSIVDQIQKIIDEEKAAGHQKEVTHAVFEEFNLTKAENLACGYYTDRVKYEAYAPYWLEHIHQEPDGKVTSDLLPGMTWHPEACLLYTSCLDGRKGMEPGRSEPARRINRKISARHSSKNSEPFRKCGLS